MIMMTLYVRQQKRHRCKEQTVGLPAQTGSGSGFGLPPQTGLWDRAVPSPSDRLWGRAAPPPSLRALGQGCASPLRWGTHVHSLLIHVNVWQKAPQYCKVISLQFKIFKKVDILLLV